MIALVTGATSGIGEAVARRFVREGHRVVGTGRRRERLAEVARELGSAFVPIVLDVRDRHAVDLAVASLPADFAAVDVLVNNAGLSRALDPAQQASLEDWDVIVDTNVKGPLYVTHAVLPGMVARGRGHVVNLGSVAGTYPYPGGNVYGASKAFVALLSKNLRADLLGTPVRVTNIEPGMVGGTEFSQVRFGDEGKAAAVSTGVDALTGDDIADIVYWAVTRPGRVNVNNIEVMPVQQAFAPLAVHRSSK